MRHLLFMVFGLLLLASAAQSLKETRALRQERDAWRTRYENETAWFETCLQIDKKYALCERRSK